MKKTEFQKDNLQVLVYEKSEEIAKAAAEFVSDQIDKAINNKGVANIVLGTGASQLAFVKYLLEQNIDWGRVVVFHLDEYRGMPETHPVSFCKYLKDRIIDKVNPKMIYYLKGDTDDSEKESMRYANLLKENPLDIACIGIGENGHIAFNDPPVADFNDPKLVKVVQLDDACRRQQLGEGWFPTLEDVPSHALTLTIPAIMASKAISCLVPDERKAKAVYNALNMEISTACPATILRKHPNAILFLDAWSFSKLNELPTS
jgi:glucosamine-6-phosphate deaminase